MTAPLTDAEAAIRQRLTAEFIAANPRTIVLQRPSRVDDGAGGSTDGAPTTVKSQVMRLVALNREVPSRTTVDGREVSPSYRLVAANDADLLPGDYWMDGPVKYEVVWVEPDRLDATRAEVVYGR